MCASMRPVGCTLGPEDAYRFAQGEEITSNSGLPAKLQRPYDWFLVSDHSDGMGTINEIKDGNPEMMESEVLKQWNEAFSSGSEEAAADAKSELIVLQTPDVLERFKSGTFSWDAKAGATAAKAGAATNAQFADGVAVFVTNQGGLMGDISVGAQKFKFTPVSE